MEKILNSEHIEQLRKLFAVDKFVNFNTEQLTLVVAKHYPEYRTELAAVERDVTRIVYNIE